MKKRMIGVRNVIDNPSDETAVAFADLYKSFRLPTERAWGLKQAFFNRLRGIKGFKDQQVLRGLNFEIKKGEFVGIIGRNGSGKSTLLKILSGTYYPEKGSVLVNGTLVPFIELAELRPFMDQKLKNYSSGMQVRLAFSIAIRAKGDILVLDEVLAVGDAAYQQKCNDYFEQLKGQQTVILVTHSMENVERFCDRAILIEDGKIVQDGDPKKVAKAYMSLFS